jgi:hypothetical protein
MLDFFLDMFRYPFDDNKNNKFHQFLTIIFKDYPAFLRSQPSRKKIVILPFLIIYAIFKKKS